MACELKVIFPHAPHIIFSSQVESESSKFILMIALMKFKKVIKEKKTKSGRWSWELAYLWININWAWENYARGAM